jgi:hypothetical protein
MQVQIINPLIHTLIYVGEYFNVSVKMTSFIVKDMCLILVLICNNLE